MDPISKIGLFKPLTPLQGTDAIKGGLSARKVQHTGGEEGTNPFGAISRINGEVTPTYAAQDSTYTNGLGHSIHKFMVTG